MNLLRGSMEILLSTKILKTTPAEYFARPRPRCPTFLLIRNQVLQIRKMRLSDISLLSKDVKISLNMYKSAARCFRAIIDLT